MPALWALLAVLGYVAYVVFGGPLWRRTTLRALRPAADDDERLAAKILTPLPAGSSDHMPRTRLDGALEILAIELERLLPMARDLDAIWWQVRAASVLSARGWGQTVLDRYARFEGMALETLARAEHETGNLDAHSRSRLEDRLGELPAVVARIAAAISQSPDTGPIEARRRPRPRGLLEALDLIGHTRQALRAPDGDPYR